MTKSELRIGNKMSNVQLQKYDLEERTAKLGGRIIEFAKKVPQIPITIPLIGQLIKTETSVGANYCEADCAKSRKDFAHKVGICRKESKETKHWIRMIAKAVPDLRKEANELNLIFSLIIRKIKGEITKSE